MRAVLCFGDFRLWDFEIPSGKEFQPIYIIHPMEQLNITSSQIEANNVPTTSIKKMEFEYHHQLDRDLLEYRFARET